MIQRKQSGFSLVEVMVVVAIIIITASVALPSYRAWIQNTKVRTAAESILNGIQKARSEALTRNTAVSFTLAANAAWTVACVTPAACPDLTNGNVETRDSGEGGTSDVTLTPAAGVVTFNGLGIQTGAGLAQVDVDVTDADRPLSVRIGAGGTVRMCDPSAATTDPRHC